MLTQSESNLKRLTRIKGIETMTEIRDTTPEVIIWISVKGIIDNGSRISYISLEAVIAKINVQLLYIFHGRFSWAKEQFSPKYLPEALMDEIVCLHPIFLDAVMVLMQSSFRFDEALLREEIKSQWWLSWDSVSNAESYNDAYSQFHRY